MTDQGTPDGSGLGLDEPDLPAELTQDLTEPNTPEETDSAVVETETPVEETPAPIGSPEAAENEEQAEATDAPAEETPADAPAEDDPIEAAKEAAKADWQKRYNDLQPAYTQATQARSAAEKEAAALKDQLERVQKDAAERDALLLQFAKEINPELAEQLEAETRVREQVSAQTEQVRAQAEQAAQQQAQQAQLAQQQAMIRANITAFAASTPEYAPGNDLDRAMGGFITYFNNKAASSPEMAGWAMNPADPATLQIAKALAEDPRLATVAEQINVFPEPQFLPYLREAADNPALLAELRYNNRYVDDEEGMNIARRNAATPQIVRQQQATSEEAKAQAQAERKAAHVELGGGPAPDAEGLAPELAEILRYAAEEKQSIV